jgi:DNA polymerase-3 subunit beta
MAKSRLTRTPHKEEVLKRAVKKKPSTATAHNSAKTVKKSVKATTETDSVCEPSTISPEEVEASQTCTNFAALPAVDAPSLETVSNEALLPSSYPLPSAIEIACDSREFNDYVQALKNIILSNSSHPILSNILIGRC